MVVMVSVTSASAFELSSTLKHVSAGQVPDALSGQARALSRFIASTVSNRFWLLGIAADVVALTLQVVALHLGALGVVQPLLITGLMFALLLRGLSEGRVSPCELGWAAVVAATLASFLALAGTANTITPVDGIDRKPAVASAVVGSVLAAVVWRWDGAPPVVGGLRPCSG